MNIYTHVVYMTIYFGTKFPPKFRKALHGPRRYIGSCKIENIAKGYRGSVASKKYSDMWRTEVRTNPHLFKTRVLSYHEDDTSARMEEKRLQKKYKVVKSETYFNLALASPQRFFRQ